MTQRSEFVTMLGTFVAGTIASGMKPANAAVVPNPSSSMYLSEEIKTLDMSLPSYDKASSLKADEQALGVEIPPEPVRKKAPAKKKSEAGSGGGDSPLASVLPSMNKSGPSKKAAKPKKEIAEKPKKAKPEPAPKVEFETMDLGLPSYSDSTEKKEKSVFSL